MVKRGAGVLVLIVFGFVLGLSSRGSGTTAQDSTEATEIVQTREAITGEFKATMTAAADSNLDDTISSQSTAIAALQTQVAELSQHDETLLGKYYEIANSGIPGPDPNGYRFGQTYMYDHSYDFDLVCFVPEQRMAQLFFTCTRLNPSYYDPN
jgi:hypothetical protein